MVIEFKHTGDFSKTERFFKNANLRRILSSLNSYGQQGVEALAKATPVDTGKTAASWNYSIIQDDGQWTIAWSNSNINRGINIAVILQYGHGTGTGGWVEGRDYINPALQPLFDKIADDAWEMIVSK